MRDFDCSARIAAIVGALVVGASPAAAWQSHVHGAGQNLGEEMGAVMVADGAGDLYIFGQLADNPDAVESTAAAVVKLSAADGHEIWRQTSVAPHVHQSQRPNSIVLVDGVLVAGGTRIDPADGSVLAGTFPGTRFLANGTDLYVSGDAPFRVVKYDTGTLNPIWTSPDLGASSAFAVQMALVPGGIVAGGFSDIFGDFTWTVAKLAAADGSVDWSLDISDGVGLNTANLDFTPFAALAAAPDGSVFVAGTMRAPVEGTQFVVKKLDPADGHVTWTYTDAGPSTEDPVNYAKTLAVTADGDVLAAGQIHGEGINPGTCEGSALRVVRLDGTTGAEEWVYSLNAGCSNGIGAVDLELDGAGGVFVGGTLYESDVRYAVAIKLSEATGVEAWSQTFPGPTDGRCRDVLFDGSQLFVAGMGDGGGSGQDFFVASLLPDGSNPPDCGNGVAAGAEQCDDGDAVDGDGCEADCTITPVSQSISAGGTATTDPLDIGATPQFPVQTAITTPNGGVVSIGPVSAPQDNSALHVVGLQLQIEAPPATVANPLVLVLTVDSSAIPAGLDGMDLEVIRDGELIADCTGALGTASPDPCIQSRVPAGDDLEITVLTSHASTWSVVVRALSKDEVGCVTGANKAGVNVAKAQAKANASCLKAAAAGTETDPQGCLTQDDGGKTAAAMQKTVQLETDACTPPPAFGFSSATAINAAAQQAELALVEALFGGDLGAAASTVDSIAQCQSTALGAVEKLFRSNLTSFLKCKKSALKGKKMPLAVSAPGLEDCFDVLDADEKVLALGIGLPEKLDAECEGIDPLVAFPGGCAAAPSLGICLDTRVSCGVCRLFNAMDDLSEDCDLFDDFAANASCP
jgi:cysteine-rich repeat protein